MALNMYMLGLIVLLGYLSGTSPMTFTNLTDRCLPQYASCNSSTVDPHLTSKEICHHNIAYSWCEIFAKICTHQISTVPFYNTTNPACNVTVNVIIHTTPGPHTTTPRPVTEFETSFFHAAIRGIDYLLYLANSSQYSVEDQKKIFSLQDHTHKRYVRNPHCWAYPLDLTSISPWNSNHGIRKAGTLITPRHAVWARHYNIPVNTTLRFVDKNNNVVDKTIAKLKVLPTNGSSYLGGYDLVVGELDSDVPSSISFAKVMPRTITTISTSRDEPIPVIDTDFEEKALVANLYREAGNLVYLTSPSPSSLRHPYYEPKITGDSGNPVFLVVDDELVLLFVFTYGGAGSGTSVTAHYDDINYILAGWASAYRLSEVDVTRFLHSGEHVPSLIG